MSVIQIFLTCYLPYSLVRRVAFVFVLGWSMEMGFAQDAPAITTQPAGQQVANGGAVALRVAVTGSEPLTYQWWVNGAPVLSEVATFAGGGSAGAQVTGLATNASLSSPYQVATDRGGNIFIADTDNHVIRKVNTNGVIQTIAGSGQYGFFGDGGLATSAMLSYPSGLAVDFSGNVFFADVFNNRVRKVGTNGMITTIAGNGSAGTGFTGNGGAAVLATLNRPVGVAVDPSGNVFIADPNDMAVFKVDSHGTITRVAGTGAQGFSGDHNVATNADLNQPFAVAVDPLGNVLIADSFNYRIRQVDTNGLITTIIGNGVQGFAGDGGVSTNANIGDVSGLAIAPSGELYFTEYDNNRVRKVSRDKIITTVAGSGVQGYSGDYGPALRATFSEPDGLAFDPVGNIYVAEPGNNVIREVFLSDLSALTISGFSTTNAGSYWVVVTNAYGSVTSSKVTLGQALPPLSASIVGGPAMLLSAGVAPRAWFILEASTNLAVPIQWELVASNAADATGRWIYSDAIAPGSSARYYRLAPP